MSLSTDSRFGLALDEYNRSTPPGWMAYMHNYPLKTYREKLGLWKRQTTVDNKELGVTIIGRLKGAAYRLIMKMVITEYAVDDEFAVRLDGTGTPIVEATLIGEEAIAYMGNQYHPTTNAQLNCPGHLQIMIELEGAYGPEAQDVVGMHLNKFFRLYRGNGSLIEYCLAYKIRYEAAQNKASLTINNIGKTHLFMEGAGLAPKFVDDIMLKVDHDRERFQEIYNIVMKTARKIGNRPTDDHAGHLLYTDNDDGQCGPCIEYYTDHLGCWYIFDHDIQASYYLYVGDEEDNYFVDDAWDYWDGAYSEECYNNPNFYTESWEVNENYFQHEEDYFGRRKGKGKGGRRPFRKGKGRRKGKLKGGYYGEEDEDDDEFEEHLGEQWYDEPSWNEGYDESYFGKGKGKGKRYKGKGKGKRKGFKGKGKGKDKSFDSPNTLLTNDATSYPASEPSCQPCHEHQDSQILKGTSKGSSGCRECGSRWHMSNNCPVLKQNEKRKPKPKFAPLVNNAPARQPVYDMSSGLTGQNRTFLVNRILTPDHRPVTKQDLGLTTNDDENLAAPILGCTICGSQTHTRTECPCRPKSCFPVISCFPTDDESFDNFHTVKGSKRFGYIIDPGASAGLGGTDTKREYDEAQVPLAEASEFWPDRSASFTGINGDPTGSVGTLRQPSKTGRFTFRWNGSLIGGTGSYCPFLLPLPPLIELKAVMFNGMFSNGDGIIVFFPPDSKELHVVRMLYTDSGHYLLPTDCPEEQIQEESSLMLVVKDAVSEMNNYITNFLGTSVKPTNQVNSVSVTTQNNCLADQNVDQMAIQCSSDKAVLTMGALEDTISQNKDQSQNVSDYHNVNEQEGNNSPGSDPGSTTIEREQQSPDMDPGLTETYNTDKRNQMRADWAGTSYTGPIWPKHFTSEQIKEVEKHYKKIPEKFYTSSKQLVVTPENFHTWFEAHKDVGFRFQFQEQFSGSGVLSWSLFQTGISVLFPVDLRYGWDVRKKAHRDLLDMASKHFKPLFKYSSPDCRLWCSASNGHPDKTLLKEKRDEEKPMLQWLHNDNRQQVKNGCGYLNENGLRSQIWTQSPLEQNRTIPQNKSIRTDACEYGLSNENGDPQEKAYRLDTNIHLKSAAKRCTGHGGRTHAPIIGGQATASTTVYIPQLVTAIKNDVVKFLRKLTSSWTYLTTSQPEQQVYDICELTSHEQVKSQLSILTVSKLAQPPVLISKEHATFHLKTAYNLKLEPNEWKGISFGYQFLADYNLTGTVTSTVPGCVFKTGLNKTDEHVVVNNLQDLALVLHNSTNQTMNIHRDVPVVKLLVNSSFGERTNASIFWSCPKCKYGGAHNEHNRIQGKCRYSPKKKMAAAPPAGAKATPKVPEVAKERKHLLIPQTAKATEQRKLNEPENSPLDNPEESKQNENASPGVDPGLTEQPISQQLVPTVSPKQQMNHKMKEAFKRLRTCRTDDVQLQLHETLKNVDHVWLKRLLLSIPAEYESQFENVDASPLFLDNETPGSTLLLKEMFAPYISITSGFLVKHPKHLVVSEDISIEDAPFRLVFLGVNAKTWESSSLERLDLLPIQLRFSEIKHHLWMISLQGHKPHAAAVPEEQILPRLKLGVKSPNFDFTKLRQQLINATSDEERVAIIRGIHEKLFHAMHADLARFISRMAVPDRCLDLISVVIDSCDECNAYKPIPRRPRFGAELAGHFGDCVIIDLFFLWNRIYMMMIDEALRYKIAAPVANKEANSLAKAILHNWIRYFGAPKCIKSDQEGGIKSETFATICDRFSMHRMLAGSDKKGEHTKTGLVEKHIQLVKVSALKTEAQCRKQGLDWEKDDIVVENTMCQNYILEYGGFTPAQGLLGSNPRNLYELESPSVLAHAGSLDTTPDYFETYLRGRMIAKVAIQKAIIEARIAEANRSKPMKLDLSTLTPGQEVDLWRLPEVKDDSGWRGPCELLDVSKTDNTAIVKHQSMPYIVPLRHVRPHTGRLLKTIMYAIMFEQSQVFPVLQWPKRLPTESRDVIHKLLDWIDAMPPHKITCMGTFLDGNNLMITVPPTFHNNTPVQFSWVKTLAEKILKLNTTTAVICGTRTTVLRAPYRIQRATLVVWQCTARLNFMIKEVIWQTSQQLKLKDTFKHTSFQGMDPSLCSYILISQSVFPEENTYRLPDLSDISSIEEEDEYPIPPDSPRFPPDFRPKPPDNSNNDEPWWTPDFPPPPDYHPNDDPPDVPGNIIIDDFPPGMDPGLPPLPPPNDSEPPPSDSNDDSPGQGPGQAPPPYPPAPYHPPNEDGIMDDNIDSSTSGPYPDTSISMEDSIEVDNNNPGFPPDGPQQPASPERFNIGTPVRPKTPDSTRSRSPHETGFPGMSPGQESSRNNQSDEDTIEYPSEAETELYPDNKRDRSTEISENEVAHKKSKPSSSSQPSSSSSLPVPTPASSSSSSSGPVLPIVTPEGEQQDENNETIHEESAVVDPKDNKKIDDGDETEDYFSFYTSCPEETKHLIDLRTAQTNLAHNQVLFHMLTLRSELIDEGLANLKAIPIFHTTSSHPIMWTKRDADFVYPGNWKTDVCFYIDLNSGEAFRVDTDTDNLTEQEIIDNWDEVDKADRKELEQFCKENVWEKRKANSVKNKPIDAIWVRKWKWYIENGKRLRKIKCRLCARGFLDSQAHMLTTRATTATKLSQRLLVSLSVLFGHDLETWDVSGAFLKGFPFIQVEQHLKRKGYSAPRREVSIRPPANVWRHLGNIDKKFQISETMIVFFVLFLFKPVYGLNDAPLAWQLVLQEFFIKKRKAIQSAFDDCFFWWPGSSPGEIDAMATTHVDDNAMSAFPKWLAHEFEIFRKEFGGATKNAMPFTHTGIDYKDTDRGRKLSQDEFCQKLKPFPLDRKRASQEDSPLLPEELTGFRAVLGGLLWLCQTRIDVICDVVLSQQYVTKATIKHIKIANATLTKAKKYAELCGIYFPSLQLPVKLGSVHDSSHATRESSYAQEGVIILLMNDGSMSVVPAKSPQYEIVKNAQNAMSGFCHVLAVLSHKAKRISPSTSAAETISAVAGKDIVQLVATRLTEILGHGILTPFRIPTPLSKMREIQEEGTFVCPIDQYTDCMDLFLLAVGDKGVPQDRYQRLYIMMLREDRIKGLIRYFYWIPTTAMLADALTKAMISKILYDLIQHGYWQFDCREQEPLRGKELRISSYSENDVLDIQDANKRNFMLKLNNSGPRLASESGQKHHVCLFTRKVPGLSLSNKFTRKVPSLVLSAKMPPKKASSPASEAVPKSEFVKPSMAPIDSATQEVVISQAKVETGMIAKASSKPASFKRHERLMPPVPKPNESQLRPEVQAEWDTLDAQLAAAAQAAELERSSSPEPDKAVILPDTRSQEQKEREERINQLAQGTDPDVIYRNDAHYWTSQRFVNRMTSLPETEELVACANADCSRLAPISDLRNCRTCGSGLYCIICCPREDACVRCNETEEQHDLGIPVDEIVEYMKNVCTVYRIPQEAFQWKNASVVALEAATTGDVVKLPHLLVPTNHKRWKRIAFQARQTRLSTLHGTDFKFLPNVVQHQGVEPGPRQDGLKAAGVPKAMLDREWIFSTLNGSQSNLYAYPAKLEELDKETTKQVLEELKASKTEIPFGVLGLDIRPTLRLALYSPQKGKSSKTLRFSLPGQTEVDGILFRFCVPNVDMGCDWTCVADRTFDKQPSSTVSNIGRSDDHLTPREKSILKELLLKSPGMQQQIKDAHSWLLSYLYLSNKKNYILKLPKKFTPGLSNIESKEERQDWKRAYGKSFQSQQASEPSTTSLPTPVTGQDPSLTEVKQELNSDEELGFTTSDEELYDWHPNGLEQRVVVTGRAAKSGKGDYTPYTYNEYWRFNKNQGVGKPKIKKEQCSARTDQMWESAVPPSDVQTYIVTPRTPEQDAKTKEGLQIAKKFRNDARLALDKVKREEHVPVTPTRDSLPKFPTEVPQTPTDSAAPRTPTGSTSVNVEEEDDEYRYRYEAEKAKTEARRSAMAKPTTLHYLSLNESSERQFNQSPIDNKQRINKEFLKGHWFDPLSKPLTKLAIIHDVGGVGQRWYLSEKLTNLDLFRVGEIITAEDHRPLSKDDNDDLAHWLQAWCSHLTEDHQQRLHAGIIRFRLSQFDENVLDVKYYDEETKQFTETMLFREEPKEQDVSKLTVTPDVTDDIYVNAGRIVPEVVKLEFMQESYRFANLEALNLTTTSQTWDFLPGDRDLEAWRPLFYAAAMFFQPALKRNIMDFITNLVDPRNVVQISLRETYVRILCQGGVYVVPREYKDEVETRRLEKWKYTGCYKCFSPFHWGRECNVFKFNIFDKVFDSDTGKIIYGPPRSSSSGEVMNWQQQILLASTSGFENISQTQKKNLVFWLSSKGLQTLESKGRGKRYGEFNTDLTALLGAAKKLRAENIRGITDKAIEQLTTIRDTYQPEGIVTVTPAPLNHPGKGNPSRHVKGKDKGSQSSRDRSRSAHGDSHENIHDV